MRRAGNIPKVVFFLLFFFEALTVILFLLGLSGCTDRREEALELREAAVPSEEETSPEEQEAGTSPQDLTLYVYVCGEVKAPGVYELPPDSRVFEAIEAAGGMTEKAADFYLNQAEKVTDGQQICVLSEEELSQAAREDAGEGGKAPEPEDGRVNLNTASKEELMTLSGIGEVKAEAIIRYREEKGGFTSIEELKEIEGIKEGVFGRVKDQIKI